MLRQSLVSSRPEVGDAADRWVPPGGDLRSRVPLISGRREGQGCWRGAGVGASWAAAFCVHWAEKKKEGGKVLGLRAENREGESFSFYFLFLFSFKNKPISKYFQNQI